MNGNFAISHHTLRRIVDFNFFPASEMDDSWWQSDWLAASLFNRLRKSKATQNKLSDFILESYQLRHENYFDFTSHEKKAALLSGTELKALLYAIGLIVESDTIANAIERDAQQTIKESLGEADYLYALKNRISISRPPAKDKITLTSNKTQDFKDFKTLIYQSGLHCLLSLLNDMPQGFIQRILFKLPKAWSTAIPLSDNKNDYQEIKAYLPSLFKGLETS